ncbi:aspartate aminotransferase family protein [Rhizobium leguminosarum]|uniref:aspartate aminotransferase family protein n=1 Tax=Rhizobium leguminosarum TaxID=384 RepID=UPI0024A94405|nr:aspartate aminotransferase family protein [Rhizobium leguminosarum]MDI5930016.1 aspartate aminotransferase family protein [Rhizobium leguminosarum]
MPGGSFNSAALAEEVDVVIARANGSKLYDSDGREYIDCLNGSGPMVLGHARPEVVEALRKAVECPSNFYVLNETGIALAEKMVEAIPCAEQLKYGLSGSDATFFAMRLARAYTGRTKILKFEGGFIGVNDYALMSVTPATDAVYPTPVPDSAGIPTALQDQVLIAPYNDLATTVAIMEKYQSELAAVIIEAQHRSIEPAPGFLEGVREAATRRGIVLIFDEVVTGFRLAFGGAQERYGVLPDLATYGKIVGGGLPLSAVVGKAEIMDLTNPRKSSSPGYSYISSTMSGNPMAAAAGLATLNVLSQPGTYERLYELGDRFRKGTRAAFERHDLPVQTLGSGPLAQLVISDKPVTDYRSSTLGDKALHKKLIDAIVARGVVTHGKFYFSLAFSDADIDQVVSVIDDALTAILKNRQNLKHRD